jgi:hypothetical protein
MQRKPSHMALRFASSIFLMAVLLWLTVSAPFVIAFQKQVDELDRQLVVNTINTKACTDEDSSNCNPFANTTEEKTESSNSVNFSEEYMHDHHEPIHTMDDLLKHDNCGHSALYIEFYGELISPPPEV